MTNVCILSVHNRRSKKGRQQAVHYVKEGPEADTNDAKPEYIYIDYGILHACMACICYVCMCVCAIQYCTIYIVTSCKPLITSLPKDTTVMEGARMEFPVQVIGTPHPTLTWYHNNTCVDNDYTHEISSNGTLSIVNAEMKHTGNYQLVATNSVGTVDGKFKLKVMAKPSLNSPPAPDNCMSHPVPMAEFGQYVSQNHANTNNGFIELYQVSHFFMQLSC